MENKTLIITIIIVVVIATIAIIGVIFMDKNKSEDNNIINTNTMVNETKTNTITNTITNTENQNNNTITDNSNENQSTETFTEKPKTQEEKAILIVKNDYGERSNIEFSVEGMDGKGRQIVVVRNSTTTAALAWYFVDVSNGKFEKQ